MEIRESRASTRESNDGLDGVPDSWCPGLDGMPAVPELLFVGVASVEGVGVPRVGVDAWPASNAQRARTPVHSSTWHGHISFPWLLWRGHPMAGHVMALTEGAPPAWGRAE